VQGQDEGEGDSNMLNFLGDEEALEFANFNPMVNDDNVWDAGK